MARRESWTKNVECPDCGGSGQASVSENDNPATFHRVKARRIESVSAGFTIVNHGHDHGQS